ncbi:MAG: hypothetical protein EHM65_05965, partial [Acidobacteriales bacterium]
MSDQQPDLHPESAMASDEVPVQRPDEHLNHLLVEAGQENLFTSLGRNIKSLFAPKLPPLQLTSKPVQVKNIWG